MALVTLVLGAGLVRYADALHVDKRELEGVDLVWDLDEHPWPISGPFAEIIAHDILEHLHDTVAFLDACHNLLGENGRLWLRVPDWQMPHAWGDPTHVRAFTELSFDYFDPETELGKKYGFYTAKKWRIVCKERQRYEWEVEMVKQ